MTAKKAEAAVTTRTDLMQVDPRNIIVIDGFNVRTDYGDLKALAESIREAGVKNPLRCRRITKDDITTNTNAEFVVIDGHRRLAASMMLANEGVQFRIPVVLEARHYSEQERTLDMWRTNDGKQLNPVERSEIVARMFNYGFTEKEIATKVGVSTQYIKNLAVLTTAPKELKKLIMDNTVSSTYAISVLTREKNPQEALDLIYSTLASGNFGGSEKKPKVTASSVSKANNKVNSVSELKKFVKKINREFTEPQKEAIKPEMKETFDLLMQILDGKMNRKKFEKIFLKDE